MLLRWLCVEPWDWQHLAARRTIQTTITASTPGRCPSFNPRTWKNMTMGRVRFISRDQPRRTSSHACSRVPSGADSQTSFGDARGGACPTPCLAGGELDPGKPLAARRIPHALHYTCAAQAVFDSRNIFDVPPFLMRNHQRWLARFLRPRQPALTRRSPIDIISRAGAARFWWPHGAAQLAGRTSASNPYRSGTSRSS
jgi:hypothetical protein